LSNAFKFTPKFGDIEVELKMTEEDILNSSNDQQNGSNFREDGDEGDKQKGNIKKFRSKK